MNNQEIKYCIYARKSSESEDRQVQSIDDQISAMNTLASKFGINVTKVYKESKSAKQPYNRPFYAEMIRDIKAGEFNGILCWQLNRLSRNPVESGELNWLLQTGVIKSIQSNDKEYRTDDNVLLFSIESGMANQFIIDLKKNSMRGMIGKADRGWLPSRAPVGYLNDKLEHTLIPDPERFDLVRKMWDMALTGRYSQQQIIDIANNEWGFTTRRMGRSGGGPLSRTCAYQMFGNIFFTGNFLWKGKLYNGNHKAMITLEEFNRVQTIFKKSNNPRPSKPEQQAYTGLIMCPCGCSVTAETRVKKLISTGEVKGYTFYHCTKQKKNITCDAKPINIGDLEKQMLDELDKFEIEQQFLDWAFQTIDENASTNRQAVEKASEMKVSTLEDKKKELKNLQYMRMKDFIDDGQFMEERTRLEREIKTLEENNGKSVDTRAKREALKEAMKFMAEAKIKLQKGDNDTKRGVLSYFGQGHTLDHKVFRLNPCDWMVPVLISYKKLENEYRQLGLETNKPPQGQSDKFGAIRTGWGA